MSGEILPVNKLETWEGQVCREISAETAALIVENQFKDDKKIDPERVIEHAGILGGAELTSGGRRLTREF